MGLTTVQRYCAACDYQNCLVVTRLHTARCARINGNTKMDKNIDVRLWKYNFYIVWLTPCCLRPSGNPYGPASTKSARIPNIFPPRSISVARFDYSAAFYAVAIYSSILTTAKVHFIYTGCVAVCVASRCIAAPHGAASGANEYLVIQVL